MISERSNTLYTIEEFREIISNAGFQIIDVYGTGYAEIFRNSDLWEFITTHRHEFSRIEIMLNKKFHLDTAGMFFLIGKKCD